MSALEKVIRPIVTGQIKGFIKEHPSILDGVLWFKPKQNREEVLVDSLAKRIILDLTSGNTAGRLRAALLAVATGDAAGMEAVAEHSAATDSDPGISTGVAVPHSAPTQEGWYYAKQHGFTKPVPTFVELTPTDAHHKRNLSVRLIGGHWLALGGFEWFGPVPMIEEAEREVCSSYHSRALGTRCQNCGHLKEEHSHG